VLGRPPGADREPAARGEDAPHLPQPGGAIREELHALLAQHEVERRVRQRHRVGPGGQPPDRGVGGPGDLQHGGVHVEPGHAGDARGDPPRDDPRAARHVEHPVGRLRHGTLEQAVGERGEERGHEVALVRLGRRALELPAGGGGDRL
jgi:hypothetical protein